jgi:hypothetical protein
MKLIRSHILFKLRNIPRESRNSLHIVLDEIQSDSKKSFIKIIGYLESLINLELITEEGDLKSLHIHIEDEFDSTQKCLLLEYLAIKLFKYYYSIDERSSEPNLALAELINKIHANCNLIEGRCPEGASAKNGGNKIWKNWVTKKRDCKILLDFYNSLEKNVSLIPRSLVNVQKSMFIRMSRIFEIRPYVKILTSNNASYNMLNASETLNEIDVTNNEVIDNLDSIVLFDCERKLLMNNFSYEEISNWNNHHNTKFTKYLIITFGKENSSINHTRGKLESIRERFRIPTNSSYIITKSEINFLLNRKVGTSSCIEFVGNESSIFWENFIVLTSIKELYELRSIKLMNIYAICYSEDIKNYIIDDLFSKRESSELLSSNTKMTILELRDDDIEDLKEALSLTLDVIINSGIKSKVLDILSNTQAMIFDESILKNPNLVTRIGRCLGMKKLTKFRTWANMLNADSKDVLILSYRDQGKYPNCYYPNLLELDFVPKINITVILPGFLFTGNYNWAKYKIYKDYHKLLTHTIRENHFEWGKLKNIIQELKPEQRLNIDWSLEHEYSDSDYRESYKIKVKTQRLKTAYGSDLFIITDGTKTLHKVVKIEYLLTLDTEEGKVFIQNLDEIQQNINIYDKIIDKKQQEEELELIRKQFNLGDETAGRLWKVLLKNLAEDQGEDELYLDLKRYFETKGIKIVSPFHFKNSWINPQSESIAPLSKRVFIELCEYLRIPKIYFIIIQRIRNASKQSSRQSTMQMNQLLKDLFNDGCFDTSKNTRDIITNRLEYYKENHPLDELGIDESYLADNLVTLVELILPELELLELETIEKNKNE